MTAILRTLNRPLRALWRSPGYAAATIVSLSLGIGANTAIFTVANAVLLNSLPVVEPERVLEIYTVDRATQSAITNQPRSPVSAPNIRDIRAQNEVFSGVAAFTPAGVTLSGSGQPTQEFAFAVTANYFEVLGIRPAAGRLFDATEREVAGAPRAEAVLSHGMARRLFGDASQATGKTVNLNSVAYTVVGVAPAGFRGTFTVAPSEFFFVPLSMHSQYLSGPAERLFNERRFSMLNTFGRLRPGVSAAQAQANLKTIASRLEAAYPTDNRGRILETSSLSEAALGFPRDQTVTAAVALSVAVGFVLLIACANLANLSMARATKRARETGIRVAMGASRAMLIRHLMSEAAALALMGGSLGIGLGWLGAKALWASRPAFLANGHIDLAPDARVLAFTLALTALSCILFALGPVLRTSNPDLSRIMNAGGRGNVQGGARSRLRRALVVSEIALALIALMGAGLFVRSLRNTERSQLGFDPENLLVANINLSALQVTPERGRELSRQLLAKVTAVPGVTSVALADSAPLGAGLLQTAFREGDPVDSRLGVLAPTPPVTPAYFETMRIPLTEGRFFNDFDRLGSTRVAVVSEAFARRMWPGQRALGKRFRFATSPELVEVVGVGKDHVIFAPGEAPQPAIWMPLDQVWQPFFTLHARTAGDPARTLPAVVTAVQTFNQSLAPGNPRTVREVIAQGLWAQRMAAGLFTIFGVLGTALAVVGVYGVLAYTVAQRTSEIGLRMAVGAQPSSVLRLVIGQSLRLTLAGIALGAAGVFGLTRLVANLLFNVAPTDPAAFGSVALILAFTALSAAAIPAWRASRIDPVTALRQE